MSADRFREFEPYDSRILDVGDGHDIYRGKIFIVNGLTYWQVNLGDAAETSGLDLNFLMP